MKQKTVQFCVILVSAFAALISFAHADETTSKEVVLSSKTVTLNVALNEQNVKLSKADYPTPVVKVLIPDLADVTILNHRNTAEGAPCVATFGTKDPKDIVAGKPALEKIDFKIDLIKVATPTTDGKCLVWLIEQVAGTIRGYKFVHDRSQEVAMRHIDDCR